MEHHFFAYISRMRFIQRWGLMRNTLPENDLEHAGQAAMFAHAIAVIGCRRYGRTYDPNFIMALALYHDAGEVITGDMPTPIKHSNPVLRQEYGKLEDMAASRLLSMLPADLQQDFRPLIAHDETSLEWRIVKAADKLCAYVKCLEEKKGGNKEFGQAGKSVKKSIEKIDLPEVQDFMVQFVPGFSLTLDEISEE